MLRTAARDLSGIPGSSGPGLTGRGDCPIHHPMTSEAFRKLALALPGAVESQHGGHPDFRIAGKVFASLGVPDGESGMVKLLPDEQLEFVEQSPGVFQPFLGDWGRRGYTRVDLAVAVTREVRAALAAAARKPAKTIKRPDDGEGI